MQKEPVPYMMDCVVSPFHVVIMLPTISLMCSAVLPVQFKETSLQALPCVTSWVSHMVCSHITVEVQYEKDGL